MMRPATGRFVNFNPVRRLPLAGLGLVAVLALSACSGRWATDYPEPVGASVVQGWNIASVAVAVPDSLTVSDANSLAPNADIVWHGDAPGDRRAQVKAIMTDAARRATAGLRRGTRAQLNITVSEFHGVTPAAIARAPSAVHNISFVAQVVEAGSGKALTPQVPIRADLPALVGSAAYYAAQSGQDTMKARVTAHVAATLKGWLGIGPDVRGVFNSAGR